MNVDLSNITNTIKPERPQPTVSFTRKHDKPKADSVEIKQEHIDSAVKAGAGAGVLGGAAFGFRNLPIVKAIAGPIARTATAFAGHGRLALQAVSTHALPAAGAALAFGKTAALGTFGLIAKLGSLVAKAITMIK